MPLLEGDLAPDFELYDHHGEPTSLQSLLDKGPLVMFFYPKGHTSGCTRQACSFRDEYERLRKLGLQLVGLSRDSAETHRSFAEANSLPFRLLVDPGGEVHRAYDVLAFFGLFPRRVTYIIGQDRRVLLAHEDNVRMHTHVQAVLDYYGG